MSKSLFKKLWTSWTRTKTEKKRSVLWNLRDSPQLFQRPIMCCTILCICDLNSDNCTRWRWTGSTEIILIATGQSVTSNRLQVRRKRWIKCICQQSKLKLNALLQFHGDCVGFFKENCIAPQIIAQGCELMVAPLSKSPSNKSSLACSPAGFKERIYWWREN